MHFARLPDMLADRPEAADPGGPIVRLDNLLDEGVTLSPAGPGRHVAWSGSMGEGLWDAHPRTWTPAGWARLETAVARLAPLFRAAGATLALRTHARHILGDPHSAARFVQTLAAPGQPGAGVVGVLADPVGMLTPGMLAHAEEHLERIFDHLRLVQAAAQGGGLLGVVLTNLSDVPLSPASADTLAIDDGPPMRRAPLHAGRLNPAWLVRGVRELNPACVYFEGDLPDQVACLAD